MISHDASISTRLRTFLLDRIVMIVFLAFVVFGYLVAEEMSPSFFANEVTSRFFRNGVLVIALIVPVLAGLGLNFGIVIGAMAGMLAIIFVRYHLIPGIGGLLLCFLIATPIAMLFGYLTGRLFNKTRGQEMITSLIVGFFAEGVYLIFVLFAIGGIIPVARGHFMIMPNEQSMGVRAFFDMGRPAAEINPLRNPDEIPGMSRAMSNLWQVDFMHALIVLALGLLIFLVVRRMLAKRNPVAAKTPAWHFYTLMSIAFAVLAFAVYSAVELGKWNQLLAVAQETDVRYTMEHLPGVSGFVIEIANLNSIPMVTGLVIAAMALFTVYFARTKLGQDSRSAGQSQHIAKVAGINVDRTRIVATMISTVLAAWGMIIFLHDMGTVNTYAAHKQVGFFSVAALLVGGATTTKASVKNAIVGIFLFHAMFIVSPAVGRYISDDPAVGEYTRSFMVYAVIGVSLGLYVWRAIKAERAKSRLDHNEADRLDQLKAEKLYFSRRQ